MCLALDPLLHCDVCVIKNTSSLFPNQSKIITFAKAPVVS